MSRRRLTGLHKCLASRLRPTVVQRQSARRLLTDASATADFDAHNDRWWRARHGLVVEAAGVDPAHFDPYERFTAAQRKFMGAAGDGTPFDVDLAALCVDDVDLLGELQTLLYKQRHTVRSASSGAVFDSTADSVVRTCVRLRRPDAVAHLLGDTINYGLFPDYQAANVYMDYCVRRQDWQCACRMAAHLMQQEMFDDGLASLLSVYACLKWLTADGGLDGVQWNVYKTADPFAQHEAGAVAEGAGAHNGMGHVYHAPDRPDLNDDYAFRMPWLKNPAHDMHFDLRHARDAVAKSLLWFADFAAVWQRDSGELPSESSRQGLLHAQSVSRMVGALLLRGDYAPIEEAASGGTVAIDPQMASLLRACADRCGAAPAAVDAEEVDEYMDEDEAQVQLDDLHERPVLDEKDAAKIEELISAMCSESAPCAFGQIESVLHECGDSMVSRAVDESEKLQQVWHNRRMDVNKNSERAGSLRRRLVEIADERAALEREQKVLFFFENRTELERIADTDVGGFESVKGDAGRLADTQSLSDEEYGKILLDVYEKRKRLQKADAK